MNRPRFPYRSRSGKESLIHLSVPTHNEDFHMDLQIAAEKKRKAEEREARARQQQERRAAEDAEDRAAAQQRATELRNAVAYHREGELLG